MGRFSVVLLLGILCLTLGGTANAAVDASNKIFVFRGKIQAVDVAAGTLTLQTDKQSYVFVVTDQTRIATKGRAQKFADVKQGQPAEVEMKIGPGGKGMAVLIQLGYSSGELNSRIRTLQFQAFFSGTAPDGKTISGKKLIHLIVHWPVIDRIGPSTRYASPEMGVFLLSVRPDGTVSNVEMLHSLGYNELDKWATRHVRKFRFRPNSVVQVKMPVQFVQLDYF